MVNKWRILLVLPAMMLVSDISTAAVPASERNALVNFYAFLAGGSWINNIGWLAGDPCDDAWFGIVCNNENTTVNSIFLPNNNLVGVLQSDFGDLTNVTFINLSGNTLQGSIPIEIGGMTNLQTAILDGNDLLGDIPVELTSISTLTQLSLHDNRLSDADLPESWSAAMQTLSLHNNQLTGSIPVGMGGMPVLTSLTMNNNRLEGAIPSELGNLASLTTLTLHRNRLDGAIPTEIGDLTNLQFLRLDSNQLTGELPGSLSNLVNLQSIGTSLSYNGLFTPDAALDAFLDAATGGDWSSTQTIAPSNIHQTGATLECVFIAWDAIEYTGDTGHYQVWYSLTPGGPYNLDAGLTTDKNDTDQLQCGLDVMTTYYFVVGTVTAPNAGNDNVVVSEFSPEFPASTHAEVIHEDGFEDI